MRIAEVVNNLQFGGAERLVTDLSLELQSRGHQVLVSSLRGLGPLSEILTGRGIEVHNLNKLDGFSLRAVQNLTRLFKSKAIDVVHTHNPLTHHYGALAGKMARVPVIVNTLHGLMNVTDLGKTRIIFELSTLMTDQIVAVCPAARDYFSRRLTLKRTPIHVINNGIAIEKYTRIQPAQNEDTVVFGTVGRLVPVKDQSTLLRAFGRLLEKHPKCRLDILGDGPIREDLESLARELAISEHVRFLGATSDVPGFLARIDLFVLSSLSEALPLTILEAMAAGLPIIGTAVGEIPALIEHAECGWLCPPGQPETMAQVMAAAIEAGDLQATGARGRDVAVRNYSLFRMGADYQALFENLLSARRRNYRRIVPVGQQTG